MSYFEIIIAVIAVVALIPATWIPLHIFRAGKFNNAAEKFKEAFTEEVRFINRDYAVDRAGRDIPEILAAAADKHEKAFVVFKDGFLSKFQRTEIEKAWKTYTGDDKLMGKYTFRQYATHNKFKDAENIRRLALERIEEILKFAKH